MFSLAVVVYELLTGRRPFDGDTDFATLYKISNETPTRPSLLRASLPAHVDEVLLRALAKQPADRFATWADLPRRCWRRIGACPARSRRTPRPSALHACGRCRFLPTFTTWRCGS